MKRSILMFVVAGCSANPVELPSPIPPPPWGAPISGGTLLVTRDGTRAVVADPDRARVAIVDLESGDTTADVALAAGSEPGRVAEDGGGRVHVALRGAGSLVTLDASGAIIAERRVCSEPRGLAWESATDLVHVACTSGELVSLPAAGGDAIRTVVLDRDLRDVVVHGSQLVVTRFRTAELLTLDAQGAVASRVSPPGVQRLSGDAPADDSGSGSGVTIAAQATVAWRTIALADGRMVMAHQRNAGQMLRVTQGGYSTPCGRGPVESAITVANPDGTLVAVSPFIRGALPVDVAANDSVTQIAFVSAASGGVNLIPATALAQPDDDPCGEATPGTVRFIADQLGAPTSVAFRGNDTLVVFYPEYPALVIHEVAAASPEPRIIELPGGIGYDAGRAVFHRQTTAGIACASCHPEARDDGQVWTFDSLGPRRTQSLAGGILSRGPYHWAGDMADLPTLMTDVFSQRMAGGGLTNSERISLGPWLDRITAPQVTSHAPADAVERGRALFMSQELACTTCHSGPLYTNNTLVDVGTGQLFKVPSLLGLAVRAPYMHDGCAATLRDRFGTCGGGEAHGHTAHLSEQQVTDLIAFLDSL